MSEAILAELTKIKTMLDDDLLSEADRFSLYGAQQALRNVLEPDVWQTASLSFYRIGDRLSDPQAR